MLLTSILFASAISATDPFVDGMYAGAIHTDAQETSCEYEMCHHGTLKVSTAISGHSAWYDNGFQEMHQRGPGWGFEEKTKASIDGGIRGRLTQHMFYQKDPSTVYFLLSETYVFAPAGGQQFSCDCVYEGLLTRTGPINAK